MAYRSKTLGIRIGGVCSLVDGTNGRHRRQRNAHEHRGSHAGSRFHLDDRAGQRGSLRHPNEAHALRSPGREESKPTTSSSMTS